MKKLLTLLSILALILCASCTREEADFQSSDYSPLDKLNALTQTEALANTIAYEPSVNPIDDYFDYYLGLDTVPDGVSDYVYFTSATTAVSEVGIFKVPDKETAQALLDAFKARGETLASVFANYSPEDTAIAENIQIGLFDDIVWFTATSDNSSIISIIEND